MACAERARKLVSRAAETLLAHALRAQLQSTSLRKEMQSACTANHALKASFELDAERILLVRASHALQAPTKTERASGIRSAWRANLAARDCIVATASEFPGCVPCSIGTYKEDYGDDYTAQCAKCESCGPGEQMIDCGGDRKGECVACPRGSFSTDFGDCVKCEGCDAGFERSVGDSPQFAECGGDKKGTCRFCAEGTYKATDGSWDTQCQSCADCPAGFVRAGCSNDSPGKCIACERARTRRMESA